MNQKGAKRNAFRVGLDEYKKDIFVDRINSGEKMMMNDIYGWCKRHQVPFWTKFVYRRDFSIAANIWNLYSYCRFKWEIRKSGRIGGDSQ